MRKMQSNYELSFLDGDNNVFPTIPGGFLLIYCSLYHCSNFLLEESCNWQTLVTLSHSSYQGYNKSFVGCNGGNLNSGIWNLDTVS